MEHVFASNQMGSYVLIDEIDEYDNSVNKASIGTKVFLEIVRNMKVIEEFTIYHTDPLKISVLLPIPSIFVNI